MEVVLALSRIRRAIGIVTNSSTDNVAPDLEILIVKAMEQRWVDEEGGNVGGWVSVARWRLNKGAESRLDVCAQAGSGNDRSCCCGTYGGF
ncbi:hypothetical protein F0562_023983 [Nyssa sinensis]|uniref:Uncharacterized protein n=1 Tax=Nyssa sinensis TaxID=561372 RepID=A0A5J5BNV2_9ASTE|nr:hypothetical protein F0562_023983 [Nyssa sinensis]